MVMFVIYVIIVFYYIRICLFIYLFINLCFYLFVYMFVSSCVYVSIVTIRFGVSPSAS
jgi:hypothetical protein